MPRMQPLSPPYEPATEVRLASMMPDGVPPIRLFRTFAKNPAMADALRGWGGYELSTKLSLSLRDREILINRTCAQCGCEYEWSVHVAFFAKQAHLTDDQIASLTHGSPTDPCWFDPRDRLLIAAADQLHQQSTLDDELYSTLAATLSEAELLDLTMLCGWYHAISFAANSAQVDLEDNAPCFADYRAIS